MTENELVQARGGHSGGGGGASGASSGNSQSGESGSDSSGISKSIGGGTKSKKKINHAPGVIITIILGGSGEETIKSTRDLCSVPFYTNFDDSMCGDEERNM